MGGQGAKEKSKFNIPSDLVFVNSPLISTPRALLAWSSWWNNKISVIDTKTRRNYATFDGASVSDTGKYEIL